MNAVTTAKSRTRKKFMAAVGLAWAAVPVALVRFRACCLALSRSQSAGGASAADGRRSLAKVFRSAFVRLGYGLVSGSRSFHSSIFVGISCSGWEAIVEYF